MSNVAYHENPALTNDELNALFAAEAPRQPARDFRPVLERSLVYVAARADAQLVGFINVSWDGDEHGFLMDLIVHPAFRLRGIGSELVRRAAATATARNVKWLHVDYLQGLAYFYEGVGFTSMSAGLMQLGSDA